MSGYVSTGGDMGSRSGAGLITGGVFVPNAIAAGKGTEQYVPTYTETAPSLSTPKKSKTREHYSVSGISLADLRLFKLLIEKALSSAAGIVVGEDAMERATAGHELLEYLEELWHLRSLRSREWQKLLALIQSSLFRAVFERFTPVQCGAVNTLIADYLVDSGLTRERLSSAVRILRDARIDAWSGLSEAEPSRA